MAFCQLTLTRVAIVAALAYLGYNLLSFYTIFYPPQCPQNQVMQRCILPAHTKEKKLEVSVEVEGYINVTLRSQSFLDSYRNLCSYGYSPPLNQRLVGMPSHWI